MVSPLGGDGSDDNIRNGGGGVNSESCQTSRRFFPDMGDRRDGVIG